MSSGKLIIPESIEYPADDAGDVADLRDALMEAIRSENLQPTTCTTPTPNERE